MPVLLPLVAVALVLQSPYSPSVERRVDDTLAKMTLDEKVRLISGVDGFYVPDIPRLGLRRLKMSDGPVGVRNYGPTTAYPAGLCMASSFDPDLARAMGVQIGHDARARGVDIWLGPGVNLARVPQNGRNFEYLGEDPILSGNTAAHIIQGVQSQGVVATVKHFAGNEHENDRNRDNSVIDERTLHELYLRQFQIAVQQGGVWAVMCSYNLLNGTYASENKPLIDILKKNWGFKGVLMSDWGAAHSTLGTVENGLDLEMPSGQYMNMKDIKPLLDNGSVTTSQIDDKVRRILRMTFSMGFDSRKQELPYPKDDPVSEAVALREAREGTVLLKNKGGILPLKGKNIIVMGPNADPAVTGGGGSAYTTPAEKVSLLEAIKEQAGPGVKISFERGVPDAESAMDHTEFPGRLTGEYFANRNLEGPPVFTRRTSRLRFFWGDDAPAAGMPADDWSARWTGSYVAPITGDYRVYAEADDGVRITIGDQKVIDEWVEDGGTLRVGKAHLEKGQSYPITVEYFEAHGTSSLRVGITPEAELTAHQISDTELRNADAVILGVGLNPQMEGEGFDRSFELPKSQQDLISRAIKASVKVILVNNSGGPVDLAPIESGAAGIIQAWYPGGVGNRAVAEIIFGKTNPTGKLALSWPRQLAGTYYASAYPSHNRTMVYREGLYMGYRWFDKNHAQPLYPFGYGLSYTSFSFSNPSARWVGDHAEVAVTLKNTGSRAGSDVVQVYTGYASSKVDRPVRELKGYHRVTLQPGESRRITILLPSKWLAYWNLQRHAWSLEPGKVNAFIGDSSEHLPTRAAFQIPS